MIEREKTDTLVIHCSATPADMDIGVDKIREWHVGENRWEALGYHHIIRRDGTLEPARDEMMQGAHAVKANHRSIGVCLIGGSDASGGWENNFEPEQFTSLKALILNLQNKYTIQYIIGHNEIEERKECPSFNVQEWLEQENIDVV